MFARMRGALCLFFVLLSLGENTQGRSLFGRGRSLGRAGHFGQGRDKEQGLGKVVCERADFQRGRLDVEEARACRRCCCLTTQNVDVSWHWCVNALLVVLKRVCGREECPSVGDMR